MSLFLLFEDGNNSEYASSCHDNDDASCLIGGRGQVLLACGNSEKEAGYKSDKYKITSKTKKTWSFVLIIMSAFFLAATYVQHNDPDPYIWMPVYLIPSAVNFLILIFALDPIHQKSGKFWKFANRTITLHICYCYTLGFWTLAHYIYRQIFDCDSAKVLAEMVVEPDMLVEEAKELIGLCLVIAWLSFVRDGNFLKFGMHGIMFGGLLTAIPIVSWILVEKLEENQNQSCF